MAGTLTYWRSQADYENDKPAQIKPIPLTSHEVLVDTEDARWGFTLRPTGDDDRGRRRTWHLRAPSEELRVTWARKLVLNTLVTE